MISNKFNCYAFNDGSVGRGSSVTEFLVWLESVTFLACWAIFHVSFVSILASGEPKVVTSHHHHKAAIGHI